MTPQTARRLRHRPDAAGFNRAWDAALKEGRLRSYDAAVSAGMEGRWRPVTRKGRLVGRRHVFDNRLLYAACYAEPFR